MERDQFSYETTLTDLQSLQRFMSRQLFLRNRSAYLTGLAGVVVCAMFLTAVIVINAAPAYFVGHGGHGSSTLSYLTLIVLLLLGAVLALMPMARLRLRVLRMQITPNGPLVGPTKMHLDAAGLTIERLLMKTTYAWGAFRAVAVEKGAVVLTIDNGMGVIIPASTFQSDSERFGFAAEISNRIGR